ncbi:MAG TPA: hypothetical protein VKA59_03795 [Vicinamibacterales bacterium]|jgi:hypothetical protein|nr:hypothetical protein [Vicinamibacterales bacterium]
MRFRPLIPVALIVCASQSALAQEWTRFVSPEDGFSANYPGKPKIETTTYLSEYRQTLPAKVYNAADALGRYTTTVVDYRGIEKLHADRAAKCQASKGANQQDGDTCQNDFRVDVAGATDHAVWNYLKRDGVKITHYMFYFVELVSGRALQMTNADKTRSFAAIHQHAGRLYIHEATVSPGMPEPILFMQSLAWADDKGLAIRYRTLYTEGYGEWKFPHEPPPFTVRDLNTSIDGTVVRPPR